MFTFADVSTQRVIKRISRYWKISVEQPKFHSSDNFCGITKSSAAWLDLKFCQPQKIVLLINVVTNFLQRHTENQSEDESECEAQSAQYIDLICKKCRQ